MKKPLATQANNQICWILDLRNYLFWLAAIFCTVSGPANARQEVVWMGDSASSAERKEVGAVVVGVLKDCGSKLTIWKVTPAPESIHYIVFCNGQAIDLDAQGSTLVDYIPIGRYLRCRSSDPVHCAISIRKLPSVRSGADDLLIRSPDGCAELSWGRGDDRMRSTAVLCDETIGALVARKAKCVQEGGRLEASGMWATGGCVRSTKDAGKVCAKDWDCENVCMKTSSSATGFCAATTKSTGCKEYPPKTCSDSEKAVGCKENPGVQICE